MKKTNCKYCKILNKEAEIKSKTMGMNHTTKHNITGNSSNMIYCIECKTSNTHVGQTKRKIKERIREHLSIKKITVEMTCPHTSSYVTITDLKMSKSTYWSLSTDTQIA